MIVLFIRTCFRPRERQHAKRLSREQLSQRRALVMARSRVSAGDQANCALPIRPTPAVARSCTAQRYGPVPPDSTLEPRRTTGPPPRPRANLERRRGPRRRERPAKGVPRSCQTSLSRRPLVRLRRVVGRWHDLARPGRRSLGSRVSAKRRGQGSLPNPGP